MFGIMPRPARIQILGDGECYVHLICRCIDGSWFFEDDETKRKLVELLLRYKKRFGVLIHHYLIMDSHLHMVCHVNDREFFSAFMRFVFSGIATFINRCRQRCGPVFNDRAKTPVIDGSTHLLTVSYYVENNAVRAGMVKSPAHYRWSSYRHYAFGETDPLVDDCPEYLAMGRTSVERRRVYQNLALYQAQKKQNERFHYDTWFFIGDELWVSKMMIGRGIWKSLKPPG